MNLQQPLVALTVSFMLWALGLALGIYGSVGTDGIGLLFVGVLALVGAGPAFLISLGLLASRTGGSWISWVGLAIVVPFGMVLAYFLMRNRVLTAISRGA